MQQEMVQLASTFSAQAAFIEPEMLHAGKATIERFLAAEPRLKVYRFYLEDIARRARAHADRRRREAARRRRPAGRRAVERLQHPLERRLSVSDGHAERRPTVKLDQAAFARSARAAEPRRPREGDVGVLHRARQLPPHLRHDDERRSAEGAFFAKARHYESALEASLDGANIPVSVYTRLVDGVNRNLPAFHRYLKLRKRMLGLDDLHYYDLYAPLVGSVKLEYTPEEAQKHRRSTPSRRSARNTSR